MTRAACRSGHAQRTSVDKRKDRWLLLPIGPSTTTILTSAPPRCGCALSRVRLSQCANRNDIYNTTSRSHTGSHRLNVAHIGSTFKVVGIEPDAAGHGAETNAVYCMAQTDAVDGIESSHSPTLGGRRRDVAHGTA